MTEHRTGNVSYTFDGIESQAYYAAPPQGGPGVIVLHAWWGLTPVFKRLCARLAGQGFTALAPDLYGGVTAATVEQAQQAMDDRDYRAMRAAAFGSVAQIRELPGVSAGPLGVVGFSMGAAWANALTEAFPDDLAAAVLFYGTDMIDFTRARAAYQCHFAEVDEWEPLDGVHQMREAMLAAGREVDFHFYPGVGHWFFEDDRPAAYHPEAAGLAWKRALAFLDARLRG